MVVCDLFSGNENVTYAVGLSLVLLGNENVTPKNGVFVGECGFANYGFVIKQIFVDSFINYAPNNRIINVIGLFVV